MPFSNTFQKGVLYEQNVCRCAAGSEERDEEGGDWYICMRSPDVGCIWNRTSGSAGADSV